MVQSAGHATDCSDCKEWRTKVWSPKVWSAEKFKVPLRQQHPLGSSYRSVAMDDVLRRLLTLEANVVQISEQNSRLKDQNASLRDEVRALQRCLAKTGALQSELLQAEQHRVAFEHHLAQRPVTDASGAQRRALDFWYFAAREFLAQSFRVPDALNTLKHRPTRRREQR